MRKLCLFAAATLAPALAHAGVITELGTQYRVNPNPYNGYEIDFAFAPLSIPGTITNVRLDLTATISPAIKNAANINILAGSVINTVTVTPEVSFSDSLLPAVNAIGGTNASVQGDPITLNYNNEANVSFPGSTQELSLSVNTNAVASGFPGNTFDTTSYKGVFIFNDPTKILANASGSAYFPGENTNATSGDPLLLLVVTYTPVPEPMSVALLGIGLVGLLAMRRYGRA